MKSTILKVTLLAFVTVSVMSCKNNEKEMETEVEVAAEASQMAAEYKIDTAASEIKWEGSKPTATHHGTIKLQSGTISVNEGTVEAGNFVVDMNSIDDLDLQGEDKANLEAHLKGAVEGKEDHFFDVNKYPTARFELTSVEGNKIKGNLTIKEKTNPIEFPATVTMEGDSLMITSESFELDRTKWDVNYGSKSIFPNLGDKFVSDMMKITISLKANKM